MYAILSTINGQTCALGFGQWTPVAELKAGRGMILHPASSIDAAVQAAKRNYPRYDIRPEQPTQSAL